MNGVWSWSMHGFVMTRGLCSRDEELVLEKLKFDQVT